MDNNEQQAKELMRFVCQVMILKHPELLGTPLAKEWDEKYFRG